MVQAHHKSSGGKGMVIIYRRGGCDEIRKIMEIFRTPPFRVGKFFVPPLPRREIFRAPPSEVVNFSYPPPWAVKNLSYSSLDGEIFLYPSRGWKILYLYTPY